MPCGFLANRIPDCLFNHISSFQPTIPKLKGTFKKPVAWLPSSRSLPVYVPLPHKHALPQPGGSPLSHGHPSGHSTASFLESREKSSSAAFCWPGQTEHGVKHTGGCPLKSHYRCDLGEGCPRDPSGYLAQSRISATIFPPSDVCLHQIFSWSLHPILLLPLPVFPYPQKTWEDFPTTTLKSLLLQPKYTYLEITLHHPLPTAALHLFEGCSPSPFLETKHLFPPRPGVLQLFIALLLWNFFSRFASSSTCSVHNWSPPGALPTAVSKRTLHKRSRTTGDIGGEKHLPLLIKMRLSALSRELVQGQASRFAKGMEPRHSGIRSLCQTHPPFLQAAGRQLLHRLSYRAPRGKAQAWLGGDICSLRATVSCRRAQIPSWEPLDEPDPSC